MIISIIATISKNPHGDQWIVDPIFFCQVFHAWFSVLMERPQFAQTAPQNVVKFNNPCKHIKIQNNNRDDIGYDMNKRIQT